MEMTTEDIQSSVSAAFDSVMVIEDTSNDAETIARNKGSPVRQTSIECGET